MELGLFPTDVQLKHHDARLPSGAGSRSYESNPPGQNTAPPLTLPYPLLPDGPMSHQSNIAEMLVLLPNAAGVG